MMMINLPALRRTTMKIGLALIAMVILLTTLHEDAEAARRRRKAKKKAPVINEKVLYERMGGPKTVGEITDEWVRLTLADSRIASHFAATTAKPERLQHLRRQLADQLCELADGPCKYKGPDMKKVHAGMNLTEADFVAFSENLFKSMQKANVPEREKNELLGRVGGLQYEMGIGGEES